MALCTSNIPNHGPKLVPGLSVFRNIAFGFSRVFRDAVYIDGRTS